MNITSREPLFPPSTRQPGSSTQWLPEFGAAAAHTAAPFRNAVHTLMLRRAWKPLAGATVLVGGPAYYYYYAYQRTAQSTFDLPVRVRGPDGQRMVQARQFALLSKADADARITESGHTTARRVVAGSGAAAGTWTHTTASLASNATIEDAHASAALSRPAAPGRPTTASDLLFFTVMDGHGGYHTSRLL